MRQDKSDRRSRRTRKGLGQALLDLMAERAFGAITVKDILARADLGRTTFYEHYSGKEDLLLSEVLQRLIDAGTPDHGGGSAPAIARCLGLFQHIREEMRVLDVVLGNRHSPLLLKHFQELLAAEFEEALRGASPMTGVPLPLQGRFVAQTFVLVMTWWAEHDLQPSAQEMEGMFLYLILPGQRLEAAR